MWSCQHPNTQVPASNMEVSKQGELFAVGVTSVDGVN